MSTKYPINTARVKQVISLLDLTNLNDDCDQKAIEALCAQATTPAGDVTAVCVWPKFVSDSRKCLGADTAIQIATVVNFPSGDESPEAICATIGQALSDGATEIDYVLPYTALISGNTDHVSKVTRTVRNSVTDSAKLKIILESGELASEVLIRTAASIAIAEGADFIKTSTGKVPVNATLESASIMLDVIANTDRVVGFKAAGGIRAVDEAIDYLNLADKLMGSDWANSAHFRFGASSLLQDALMRLDIGTAQSDSGGY